MLEKNDFYYFVFFPMSCHYVTFGFERSCFVRPLFLANFKKKKKILTVKAIYIWSVRQSSTYGHMFETTTIIKMNPRTQTKQTHDSCRFGSWLWSSFDQTIIIDIVDDDDDGSTSLYRILCIVHSNDLLVDHNDGDDGDGTWWVVIVVDIFFSSENLCSLF